MTSSSIFGFIFVGIGRVRFTLHFLHCCFKLSYQFLDKSWFHLSSFIFAAKIGSLFVDITSTLIFLALLSCLVEKRKMDICS